MMGFFERLMGEEPNLFQQWLHCDDKGFFGEYLTQYALDSLPGYSKVLCNIYMPYRGGTSEIDVLMLHEKGIFVFESKNYSGWIFGSAEQRQWTQCLANKEKRKFYNPLMQNKTHINALVDSLKIHSEWCRSYIIFSERCTLKAVPENTENHCILRRPDMLDKLKADLKARDVLLTKEQIDSMCEKLTPLTHVTAEAKQEHISKVHEIAGKNESTAQNNICPKCGGKLIERNGKYGKFMGCSNYPKCRFIMNIK